MTRTSHGVRAGVTLFEVVVAMVIFALTLPALNTLVTMGTQRAEESAYLSRASMECRSKLAEVTVGAAPMETTDWTPFTDMPDMTNWTWKLTANNGDVDGLKQVQVSVKFDPGTSPVQVTLSQYVIDPASRGSTLDRMILKNQDAANAQAATPSTDDSSTTATGTAATTGAATSGATGATGTTKTGTGATTGGATSGSGAAGRSTTGAATGGATSSGATGGATGGATSSGTTGRATSGTTGKGG